MMAGTHMAAGLAVGYAVSQAAGLGYGDALLLCGAGALAAILPDIDHPNSAIRQRTGVVGWLVGGWFGHRGFTHTVPAVVIAGVLAGVLLPELLALVITASYASHLLLDAFTRSGVPLAWPLTSESVHLLPRPLQVRTGSWRESAFMVLLMGVGVALWAVREGRI